ncbi:MAG: hypothetical protein RJA06_689, partial [Bacteroidota bacterium]
ADLVGHLNRLPPARDAFQPWELDEFRPEAVAQRFLATYRRVGAKG